MISLPQIQMYKMKFYWLILNLPTVPMFGTYNVDVCMNPKKFIRTIYSTPSNIIKQNLFTLNYITLIVAQQQSVTTFLCSKWVPLRSGRWSTIFKGPSSKMLLWQLQFGSMWFSFFLLDEVPPQRHISLFQWPSFTQIYLKRSKKELPTNFCIQNIRKSNFSLLIFLRHYRRLIGLHIIILLNWSQDPFF